MPFRIRINAVVCLGNPTVADLAAKLTINPNYMYKMYIRTYTNATTTRVFIRMHVGQAGVTESARFWLNVKSETHGDCHSEILVSANLLDFVQNLTNRVIRGTFISEIHVPRGDPVLIINQDV